MQMMADTLNLPIKVNKAEQTSALGAAMFAATVAGIHPSVEDAMEVMGQGFEKPYFPHPGKNRLFEKRFLKYLETGAFTEKRILDGQT